MLTESLALFAQIGAGGMPEGIENQVGFMVGFVIGYAIVAMIFLAIVSLINALFLQLAVKWVCRIELPYWFAYARALILNIICFFVGFVIGLAAQLSGSPEMIIVAQILSLFLSIIISGVYYGMAIKDYQGMPIGIGKGFLIFLVLLAIGIAIMFVIFAVVAAIVFGIAMIGP